MRLLLRIMTCMHTGLVPVDPARGQSTNQELWLPTYCVLCLDTIGSNGHRPQGLIELRMNGHLVCFPSILPRYINGYILRLFLNPLVPMHHPDLTSWGLLNGGAVGAGLRQVFNGFFVQFSVVGRSEVVRDIVIAAPTIMLQLHLYRVDLPSHADGTKYSTSLGFCPWRA